MELSTVKCGKGKFVLKSQNKTFKMASVAVLNADDNDENSNVVVSSSLKRQKFFRDLSNPLEEYTHDDDVRLRFRFRRHTIYQILDQIADRISHPTTKSRALPALIQLLCALRFYASGAFYHVIGDLVHVNKSQACRAITRVSKALRLLTWKLIKFPNREKMIANKLKFGAFAGMPGVVGLVDGILFEIKSVKENPADYVCRKQFPAVNAQVKV